MDTSYFVTEEFHDLNQLAVSLRGVYARAEPFPHIELKGFFREEVLSEALETFTDLANESQSIEFKDNTSTKLATRRGETQLRSSIKNLLRYLNSSEFIDFLQVLTSIEQPLIPDPHFCGGGLHEIKRGGFLKIHSDFCRHDETRLDRRVNVLIYLNNDWEPEFGGNLELWDQEMAHCVKSVVPGFNTMVIFNTTDFTFHGHPDPLCCPDHLSRKSIALYYYSNGRPNDELRPSNWTQSTIYRERPGESFLPKRRMTKTKSLAVQLIPPIIVSTCRRIATAIKDRQAAKRIH